MRKLAAEFGLAKDELTKGLYDAPSAGVPKENASSLCVSPLGSSRRYKRCRGCIGNYCIIDAYNLTAAHSEAINDKIFTAVKHGVITYDQIATKIGSVAALRKKLASALMI